MQERAVLEQMDKIGELTVFKTGKQALDDAKKVSADHAAMVEVLGKKKK